MIPCRITPDGKLGKVLIGFSNRQVRKFQIVGIITGNVGVGKSRSLALNIIDFWYKEILKIIPPKDSITTDIGEYIVSLKSADPYKMILLDEAIDSFGKGVSNRKLINALDNMFSICRERGVGSLIVLDDIFRLTTYIARHITFWVHVERRFDNECRKCRKNFVGFKCPYCETTNYIEGKVVYNFYTKDRLNKILMFNENRNIKTIKGTKVLPNFRSYIREYKGELIKHYNNLKNRKTSLVMDRLEKEFVVK